MANYCKWFAKSFEVPRKYNWTPRMKMKLLSLHYGHHYPAVRRLKLMKMVKQHPLDMRIIYAVPDDWSDALRTEFTVKIGEETELLSYCSSLAENCLVQKNFFV
jgi:hypothetical protein